MTQTVSTESPMELSPRERLIPIMKREQALFIRQTLSQKPGYRGGKKAFEYFIRQKIVKAVEAGCGDAEALLRTPKPVKSILVPRQADKGKREHSGNSEQPYVHRAGRKAHV